jgi:hypothetical protein
VVRDGKDAALGLFHVENAAHTTEAKLATVRHHYEHARKPFDGTGHKDGPEKDAVVSALSLLVVNIESM